MISVVISTYKRDVNVISRSITSVCNQTYKEWELYVVDDSPSSWEKRGAVKAFVESYASNNPKIHYVQHKTNLGACAARNTGLRHAKGDYIAFLDDDDEWVQDKLEKQLKVFENSSVNVALVYCGCLFYYEDSETVKRHKDIFIKGKVFDRLIARNFIGSTSLPLIRTDALREVGGFDELMQSGQDVDVWLRLAEKYDIDYVDEPLVIYHIHRGEQISTSPKKLIEGHKRRIKKNIKYLNTHRYQYNGCIMNLACAYAYDCQIGKALKSVWKGINIYPYSIISNVKAFLRIAKWTLIGIRRSKT